MRDHAVAGHIRPVTAGADAHRGLGARGVAQLGRNPDCLRLAAIRLSGRDPAVLARTVYGDAAHEKGSQIALLTGVMFERSLLAAHYTALLALLHESGRLAVDEDRVVNVEACCPGADPAALQARERLTNRLLLAKARGESTAPHVIYHARLTLDVAGIPVVIEPDLLTARSEEPMYRAGEAKIIRDRGAETNRSALAMARLQAAVETLALRDTLSRLGVADADVLVPAGVDLVLRRRVGPKPSLRTTPILREVDTLRRVLDKAVSRRDAALAFVPAGESLDSAQGIEAVPARLRDDCREHCPLAARCEAAAWAAGNPAVLGGAMERAVSAVGSLGRLVALLGGATQAANPEEAEVVRGFAAALARLEAEGVRRAS